MRYGSQLPERDAMSETATPAQDATARPQTRDRAQIAERFTWDLGHIFADWGAWRRAMDEVARLMESYQAFRGTLAQGPQHLLAACRLSDELGQLVYRAYQYPGLMQAQDTRDNAVQARLEEVRIALARFRQASAWYTPELLTIPHETMRSWLDATPELAPYRFPIEEAYRQQEHVLDEDGERLLAFAGQLGANPAQTYSMLADADVDFPEVTLSDGSDRGGEPRGLRTRPPHPAQPARPQGAVRRPLHGLRLAPQHLRGDLQRSAPGRLVRGASPAVPTTLAANLDENNIPVEVVERLIAAAKAGAEPLRRYHRLRRQVLGLERYHSFDAYLPLVELDWQLPYDELPALVAESVAIFGDDYRRTVERAFAERWIDVYENEGKRSGAFSAGVYGVHPYMLLNHADTLNDAFTLAHEMGHTMHTELSHSYQPFATSSYSIFVAEVASMTNESLFLDLLLCREADRRRRVALLQHAIDDIAASFYRQAMFADFELEAHRCVERGEPVTAEALQQLYLASLHAIFESTLDDTECDRNTWARIPHFYGSPYYVYQYATSKAVASLLHRRMTDGPPEARAATVERYLELLRAGGNDHPIAQLRRADVDVETAEPVEALVATMASLVDQLEAEVEGLTVKG